MKILILVVFFVSMSTLAGCGNSQASKPLPATDPKAVVTKFFEYVSEAGIRGGTLPLKEAYKLISPASNMNEQRFTGIVNKYPPGFKIEVVNTTIQEKQRVAVVTIAYQMASMFDTKGYQVKTDIPMVVDEEHQTWKIDFTGESDEQDPSALKQLATKAP
ncbi:MAG: hypothetical protein H7839_03100 [Magnetococcus sp. YQC-5]